MKNFIYILVCLSGFLVACSSQDKHRKDDAPMATQNSTALRGPERMQISDISTDIEYKGKQYRSTVVRRPDESLPIVKNEEGEEFVDNRITLRLTCGGKTVVEKAFTKESFAAYIDARFMKHALLEGLVYDQTTPQGIIYAASVCYPNSDLYVPLRLTVTPDGRISISKEDLLDDYQPDSIQMIDYK